MLLNHISNAISHIGGIQTMFCLIIFDLLFREADYTRTIYHIKRKKKLLQRLCFVTRISGLALSKWIVSNELTHGQTYFKNLAVFTPRDF